MDWTIGVSNVLVCVSLAGEAEQKEQLQDVEDQDVS